MFAGFLSTLLSPRIMNSKTVEGGGSRVSILYNTTSPSSELDYITTNKENLFWESLVIDLFFGNWDEDRFNF